MYNFERLPLSHKCGLSLTCDHLALLDKLDYAERLAREEQIQKTYIQPLTCDWVWSMSDSRSSFKQWLQNDEFLFWIQGKPGSGKSTLMFYLSRQGNEVLDQLNSSSRGLFNIAHFFFDFRANGGIANNLEGLLRSLYGQIVTANPGESSELAELYNGPRWSSKSLDLNVLRDSLAQLLR